MTKRRHRAGGLAETLPALVARELARTAVSVFRPGGDLSGARGSRIGADSSLRLPDTRLPPGEDLCPKKA